MYDVWFCWQLEMNRCLDEINELILHTTEMNERVAGKVIKQEVSSTLNQFRVSEKLVAQVSKSRRKAFPFLKLKREKYIPTYDATVTSLPRIPENFKNDPENPFDLKIEVDDECSLHNLRDDEHLDFSRVQQDLSTNHTRKITIQVAKKKKGVLEFIKNSGDTEDLVEKAKTWKQVKPQLHTYLDFGQQFVYKTSLFTHAKYRHADIIPYFCILCSKYFPRRRRLELHILSHTKEKPYICKVCSKEFRFKDVLLDHQKIHRGETIQCRYCPKELTTRQNRRTHERSIHKAEYVAENANKSLIRPKVCYNCMFCKNTFLDRSSFRRHIQAHNGDKPFEYVYLRRF